MSAITTHIYQIDEVVLAVDETLATPIPSFGHGWVANIASCVVWLAGTI